MPGKDVLCMVAVIVLISIPESLCTVVPYYRKVRDIYKNLVGDFAICSKHFEVLCIGRPL